MEISTGFDFREPYQTIPDIGPVPQLFGTEMDCLALVLFPPPSLPLNVI